MSKPKLWTNSFVLVSTMNFFVYLVYYLLMIIIAGYAMDHLHASPSQAGLAVGIFILGALISRIYAGSAIERIGYKRMFFIGLSVYLIATILYFNSSSLWFLSVTRFLHGIGFGIASIATGTVAANLIPIERRGEGISYYAMSTTLASAIGPFLGMYLNQHVSFYAILVVCMVILAVSYATVFFLKLPKAKKAEKAPDASQQLSIDHFIERKALPIAVIGAFVGFGYSSIVSFLSSYTSEINLATAGSFFFIVYSAAILISRPMSGRLFDTKTENHVMYPAFVLFAIGLFVLGQARYGLVILLAGGLIGLGFGTFLSSGQAIAVKLSPSHRIGLATSTFLAITDAGVGIGPFLLGILVPLIGFRGLFEGMAGLVLATMGLYYFLHGKRAARSHALPISEEFDILKNLPVFNAEE